MSCTKIDILKGHTIYTTSPHFSPDSKRIVTGSVDYTVRIWDVCTKNKEKQFDIQSVNRAPCFNHDGLQIAFVSNDSTWIYDVSSRKRLYSLKNHGYVNVCFDTQGKFHAVSFESDTIYVFDSTTNTWNEKSIDSNGITAIAVCPEKKQIATTSKNGLVSFWDLRTGTKQNAIETQSAIIKDISYNHAGDLVITTSEDGIIGIYELNKSEFTKVRAQNTAKSNVIVSHSKKEIITCDNNVINVIDIKTGKIIRSFYGHTAKIYGLTLSNNDEYLISVSHDSMIKIWDYVSGVCVQNFIDEQNKYVSFSPDEKCFATTSYDYGIIKIWPFPPLQELIDQTRERFKDRPLTVEERRMYYLE